MGIIFRHLWLFNCISNSNNVIANSNWFVMPSKAYSIRSSSFLAPKTMPMGGLSSG